MAPALHRYVGTIPISERRVELLAQSSESAASRSVPLAALRAKVRPLTFQGSPWIQEERLGFIDEIGRSGFSRAAHITECCGVPSVGVCGAAGPAGLDEERGVGKRF